ncbi:MAG TPA: endonuclease/exonuclease/phosphatase family protein [Aggregatilineales bacterium]|nr:endonuclease/exonuclease/phosphatase family protein [Aggregatilineales bacterium]
MPEISMLTMNIFGVPLPSTRRRLATLARELNHADYDVVCLQEVQANTYLHRLLRDCKSYAERAYAPFVHAPKGGLLTLARHGVAHRAFTLYRDRGLWHTPAMTDWILHKGVLTVQTRCYHLRVSVLNTHLTANYNGVWDRTNQYARQERLQLRQLAEIVRRQPADALVIAAGDFNVPRGSPLIDEFLAESGLTDPLVGSTEPTYRPLVGLPTRLAVPIDFVLYRAPALPGFRASSQIVFQDRVPLVGGGDGYLSDHRAVELRLTWETERAGPIPMVDDHQFSG